MVDFWGGKLSAKMTDMIRSIEEQTVQLRSALLEASKASVNSSVILAPTSSVSTNTDQAPTRPHGYVNWNSTHDVIKTQNWKIVSVFTEYCGAAEIKKEDIRTRLRTHMYRTCYIVDEKTRFPHDACDVFINVSDPKVCAEVLYILHVPKPAPRLLEHLLTTMKDHMHTRSSFEEIYKLKWVEPSKEQP